MKVKELQKELSKINNKEMKIYVETFSLLFNYCNEKLNLSVENTINYMNNIIDNPEEIPKEQLFDILKIFITSKIQITIVSEDHENNYLSLC